MEIFEYVLFIGVVLVVAVLLWPRWKELRETSRINIARGHLEPCLNFPGLVDGRLISDRLEGTYAGYEVNLTIGTRVFDDMSVSVLRYALRLPGRPYSQDLPRAADLEGSLSPRGAQAESAQRALAHLRTISALELEVADGWLVGDRPISGYAKGPTSLAATFGAMAELAPLLARRTFRIEVQERDAGPPVAESEAEVNVAWSERGSGQPLCPYCRDELDSADLELSRCERCHTVHHSECFAELGRCSVFGCGGERREGLRA